ncbi:MAG: tetratricopeptide repeat protein [Gemmatimonadales bacterium]
MHLRPPLRSRWSALLLAILPALPLAAQIPVADSAWNAGDYHTARIGYEQALHDNPGSVRALYRLAILASWAGQLDSALALLRDAREVEPMDPDVRLEEARVLAWNGQHNASIARYDSLISERLDHHAAELGRAQALAWAGHLREAEQAYVALIEQNPADVDARAGRGQAASWRGDLTGAARYYLEALALQADHVPSLVGLAQVRQWQGRPDEARHYAARAVALAPDDRAALGLQASIRALNRPQLNGQLGWSHDSDRNTLWWQTIGASIGAGNGLRAFGSAGLAEASDPTRTGTRLSGEVGATYNTGNLSFTGAFGARNLAPDSGARRSTATWRASVSDRFAPTAGIGVGYSHYSFDETAFLLTRNLDIDELSLDGDVELHRDLTLGYGGSMAWLSDNNRRHGAVAALTQRIAGRWTAGIYGRILGYDNPGIGYFAPDRFLTGEFRGAFTYGWPRWEAKVSAGLGAQQIGKHGRAQSEWHGEARLARRWAVINEVALSAGVSNSAASSTTGAFRYYTAALSVRLGL